MQKDSLVQVYVQEGKDLQSVRQGDFFRWAETL